MLPQCSPTFSLQDKKLHKLDDKIKEAVDEVYSNCTIKKCREKGNIAQGPNAAIRMIVKPGQRVSIDLKIRHGDRPILYAVDNATNYVAACILDNKTPEEVATKFVRLWFGRGLPCILNLVSDNGLEFTGKPMIDLLRQLGINHIVGSPYHPEQNGLMERIHAIVDDNIQKLMEEDPRLTDEIALIWACNAHNAIEKRTSFSPNQLMFGIDSPIAAPSDMVITETENLDIEYVFSADLLARKQSIINHQLANNALKLRQLLLRKSRPPVDPKAAGTWVWVKCPNGWHGPGKITAVEGTETCIKMGARWWSAKSSDLLPLTTDELARYTNEAGDKIIRVADDKVILEIISETGELESAFLQTRSLEESNASQEESIGKEQVTVDSVTSVEQIQEMENLARSQLEAPVDYGNIRQWIPDPAQHETSTQVRRSARIRSMQETLPKPATLEKRPREKEIPTT